MLYYYLFAKKLSMYLNFAQDSSKNSNGLLCCQKQSITARLKIKLVPKYQKKVDAFCSKNAPL